MTAGTWHVQNLTPVVKGYGEMFTSVPPQEG